ncbi:MAG TPA: hypothetical protein EYQ50_23885, partial [Verrucomicrobiales bacterium]|nr:hypothetical protein [Verrucomicrobiales bacterium]
MKKIFLTLWLLLPILLVTYHYGPGQDRLKRDDVSMMLQAADHYVAVSNWGKGGGKSGPSINSTSIISADS